MAKKQNSGLGRGLDSLIPKIEDIEKDVEEGVSLEDLLKKSEKEEDEEKTETVEEKEDEKVEKTTEEAEEAKKSEEIEDIEEEIKIEEIEDSENIEEEASKETDETEEETSQKEEKTDEKESSQYTNIFSNDDEEISDTEAENSQEKSIENIESSINLNEPTDETVKNIEAPIKENEVGSLLSEKEEKLVCEVIETVENNPRITLWSARSAAVLRYLRKTEPEFSISNEASNLIDAAIAEKYPEIWTLFNHL